VNRGDFSVDLAPSESLRNRVCRDAPANPFYTTEYSAARYQLGDMPIVFSSIDQSVNIPGFIHRGTIASRLEIPSLPQTPSDAFLFALRHLCETKGIYETTLNTYASPSIQLPALPNEMERIARTEFSFDLRVHTSEWKSGTTHKRHIRQAERAGVSILRARSDQSIAEHVALIGASMRRRKDRGEDVSIMSESPEIASLVRNGAGEMFQAVGDGVVLSSVFVLRAAMGGYDHSSGTRPEGMDIGASHYLMFSIAKILQNEGCTTFNLGGARIDEKGLTRFKTAFGTTTTKLEMVRVSLCSPARRMATRAMHAARRSTVRARAMLRRG
jgi:hypothetical protein